MKYKIVKQQGNSRLCAVCGIENPFGFDARFYETDTDEVIGVFKTKTLQQSFPTRVHGGVISAIMDECIGRAIWVMEPDVWAVTVEMSLRYKKPIPLDSTLKCIGRITRNTRKIFEGSGEIFLEDGSVAIEATAKYWKVAPEEIDMDLEGEWFDLDEELPFEIEI